MLISSKPSPFAVRGSLLGAALCALGLSLPGTALAQKKPRIVTISEVTIVGRVQKPIAAVDVSRIQPKLTLAELRQPFLDRIENVTYHHPFRARRARWTLPGWSFDWRVLVAALISAGCGALAWRRLSKLARLAPPPVSTLLRELAAENPAPVGACDAEQWRLAMIADLNQRLGDISFVLDLIPPTYAALTRVCLASGT